MTDWVDTVPADCPRDKYALGLCQPHYRQAYDGRPPTRRTVKAVCGPMWKVPRP